jgi:hypothetical protein
MLRPWSRASSRAIARATFCVCGLLVPGLLVCGLVVCMTSAARAEPLGPYAEFDALPEPGYELRLSVDYHYATREDFRELVFLVDQPLQRVGAYELRSTLDLRVSVTRHLALQAVLPVTVRGADVELQPLVVSRTQALAGRTLHLRGAGVADPTMALGYRVIACGNTHVQLDLGTRVPIDDNPGSPVLPERLPLGTGQNQLFLGASANLRLGKVELGLGYRFEYQPGSTATYLVRQVGAQGYTSGALDIFTGHRISALIAYAFDDVWSVRIAPDFHADEQPKLVERNGTTAFLPDHFRFELVFDASVQAQLSEHHALRLGWSQPLLIGWDYDPFFPISIPEQGIGLTWRVTSR